MSDKTFKNHDELISLLIKRGIDISTSDKRSRAKKILQHIGYYNLINGYSKLFLSATTPDDKYKHGTTVDEIYSLYEFDRRLRDIFFKYILEVETHIKSLISYVFPQKYGYDNYMLYNNFDTGKKNAEKQIMDVIADFQRQIASRSSDPSISHYLKKYGYVPLWVANNILTLGQISKFYSIMKQPDRQAVSKTFKITDNQLESILTYLSVVRNFCAHGNRLYCFRTKRPLIDFPAHLQLGIAQTGAQEFEYGKRDLFASMIALSYVLPKAKYDMLIKELYCLFRNIQNQLHILRMEDIYREMGFPNDWREKLRFLSDGN
jgi:abortive infection bacteriophage resistance protein